MNCNNHLYNSFVSSFVPSMNCNNQMYQSVASSKLTVHAILCWLLCLSTAFSPVYKQYLKYIYFTVPWRLFSIVSHGLSVHFFPSNLPVDTAYSCVPPFILCLKNADGLLQMRRTSYLCEFVSLDIFLLGLFLSVVFSWFFCKVTSLQHPSKPQLYNAETLAVNKQLESRIESLEMWIHRITEFVFHWNKKRKLVLDVFERLETKTSDPKHKNRRWNVAVTLLERIM